jgi:hypothetical protein
MDFDLFEFPIVSKKLIVLFVIKSVTYKYTILLTEFKFRRQKKLCTSKEIRRKKP